MELVQLNDERVLTAVEVYNEGPTEESMPDEGRMNARAGRVVDTEVIQLLVAAEKVAFLLVNH